MVSLQGEKRNKEKLAINYRPTYMLWLKFFFGLKIFKPVWFLFSFVSEYGNESETKAKWNWTGLKIFKEKFEPQHIHVDKLMV